MKKLFSLLSALLLWHTMAMAQNYLHITQGDTVRAVPIAQLDSVTVRNANFYGITPESLNGKRYSGNISDYWGNPYNFNIGIVWIDGNTMQIHDLDPYFAGYGYVADAGYNILQGELTIAEDGQSATLTCETNQGIGYTDCVFTNPFESGAPIVFTITKEIITCESGYAVGTSEGYYTAFSPFTLHSSTYAPQMRQQETEAPLLPTANQTKNKSSHQVLMPMNSDKTDK